MNNNETELEEIIKSLNTNENVSNIISDNLDNLKLEEHEKELIRKFQPEKKLIIYGTLAPGKPNYSKIEHIKGEWKKAVIKGVLQNKGWGAELGFYGFKHANADEQTTIEAQVLFSDELVANWPYLDDFEGDGYKRILARYELENGEAGAGYIYAINEI